MPDVFGESHQSLNDRCIYRSKATIAMCNGDINNNFSSCNFSEMNATAHV